MAISTFMYIIFGATIAYLIIIAIITLGWYALSAPKTNKNNEMPFISIVIAVRNESKNITKLLGELVNQRYKKSDFEIVIIDDNSDDNTVDLIDAFTNNNKDFNIKLVQSSGKGKKSAVIDGIRSAKGGIIITTDGDCTITPYWIPTMADYLISGYKVITGPVVYSRKRSLLSKFYELDFLSLVASGAGSIGAGLPLMGNAANMAFYKEDYLSLMENNKRNNYASGDDVFFIHAIYQKYGNKSVGFVKDEEAIVSTNPPGNISSFLNQRIRWASKAKGYSVIWPVAVALIVFIYNLVLCGFMVLCFFIPVLFPVLFLLVLAKFIIDLPLLSSAIGFTKKGHLKLIVLLSEFIYPVYIVFVAIKSLTGKFTWKSREYAP